jgi:hypothetical protein
MALQKSYTTPSGAVGNYHVIGSFRWEPDGEHRQASALIKLYVSKAAKDAGCAPLVPVIGKFRIFGAAFDSYLSRAALAASDNDIVAQLYVALKAASVAAEESGERDRSQFVASDCGPAFYHDATSV